MRRGVKRTPPRLGYPQLLFVQQIWNKTDDPGAQAADLFLLSYQGAKQAFPATGRSLPRPLL
jgi:hypothetical protein